MVCTPYVTPRHCLMLGVVLLNNLSQRLLTRTEETIITDVPTTERMIQQSQVCISGRPGGTSLNQLLPCQSPSGPQMFLALLNRSGLMPPPALFLVQPQAPLPRIHSPENQWQRRLASKSRLSLGPWNRDLRQTQLIS